MENGFIEPDYSNMNSCQPQQNFDETISNPPVLIAYFTDSSYPCVIKICMLK